MSKTYSILTSRFFCTSCGKEGVCLPRKKGQERKAGHLKKLYCLNCGKECNFCEIKANNCNYDYNDFLLEFNHNNFTTEGERKLPYNQFKMQLFQKEEIN